MRLLFFLLCLFSCASLSAQEKEAQQAARYFEAKQYATALDLYESLLKKQLTPWEKSVVLYNIGCVLFAQGKLEEAVDQWFAIPDELHVVTRVRQRPEFGHILFQQSAVQFF